MINSTDFIKRLEKILSFYGITATILAEKINFNRSSISHLLSGRNKPSLEFVMKLTQKFPEVPMDWLLFGKGSFPASVSADNMLKKDEKISSQREGSVPDLFSDPIGLPTQQASALKKGATTIEKVIILYTDGSFNVYQN